MRGGGEDQKKMRANKEQEGVRVWKENIVAMEVFVNKKDQGGMD
jgi:hypothetical protein